MNEVCFNEEKLQKELFDRVDFDRSQLNEDMQAE